MSIADRYRNKRILITGTTGFLGKVLLEKFLYSLSCVAKIYVLIRRKKGFELSERFKKEIVSSPCFDRIRDIHKNNFDAFIESKIQPIQGDLTLENLGLSPQDHEELVEKCNIIINCAASIDFNARLDFAIESNINGSLRMLKLAGQMKHLDIFTQISTCYVNCNRRGLIHEEIYDNGRNPEEQLAELISIPKKELISQTSSLLSGYPNTYTYTKALCERVFSVRKGNLPVCIVRPAIINSSYAEPFPGWLDSIAAAAALYLFVGMGIIKFIEGNFENIGDTVPVDMVVANIIVATAYNFANPKLSIYHSGSSDRNPLRWRDCSTYITQFWNSNISSRRMGTAKVTCSQNKAVIALKRLQQSLPIWLYKTAAPMLGKQHMKNAEKMVKTSNRGDEISKIFLFFINNEWIYETHNFKDCMASMSAEDRKCYLLDSADIDMKHFIYLNNYGLQKYILKENIEIPTPNNYNLLGLRDKQSYFSDLKWVMANDLSFNKKNPSLSSIKIKILSSHKVTATIENQIAKRMDSKNISLETARKAVHAETIKIVNQIVGEIRVPVVRFMAWAVHKIFKNIYEKVNINMEMFSKLREIEEQRSVPIVLMPTHRSYIDFLIVSYIFFVYKLKLPYIVTDEALMSANLLPFLIKSSGAFFYHKKAYNSQQLYKAIFNKYIECLLRQGNNLEFFIQGTRSRTGKILFPQNQILDVLLDTVLQGKLEQVCLVPLTINYQKVLEGDTFPNELLGEEKVQESVLRIVKAIPLLRTNFGRVYVEICNPIFIKQFHQVFKQTQSGSLTSSVKYREALSLQLRGQIIARMIERIVIMSTGIVSAVLLMHRKGIQEEQLIKAVNWISRYIIKKGYKIGGINENSSTIAVRNALGYLSDVTKKIKKNIFEVQICVGDEFQKILMLSYYRNTIIHAFMPEALVGTVMASFGNQLNTKEGIKLVRVYEKTLFLANLIREEYNTYDVISNEVNFRKEITKMEQNLILDRRDDDKIVINPLAFHIINFHCSLLRSLIECSWACLVYIITISRNESSRHQITSLEKFFDTVQWYMESLYDEKVIEHYEACSLESIKNAFSTYEQQGVIRFNQENQKDSWVEVTSKMDQLESLENGLKFFIKSLIHNSVLSPMDLAKSSLNGATLSKL